MIIHIFEVKDVLLERISCHNFIEVDGYAYFSNWFCNGLFKVKIGTGETNFLGCFEDESYFERNLHWEVFLKGKNIYFCPRRGRHVHIYNLFDKTICSIEIRKESEDFFLIDRVVLEENYVCFIPKEKNISIKKLDFKSLKVTEISREFEFSRDLLPECKDVFPVPELIDEYHIEYAKYFFWRQISNRTWYSFLPVGRHLLRYKEGSNKIEIIPLTVVNEEKLEGHLYKAREQLLKGQLILERSLNFNLAEFMDIIKIGENYIRNDSKNDRNVGNNILLRL